MEHTASSEYAYASPAYYDLYEELISFCNDIVIVEGKKDVSCLQALGFHRVYALHIPNCSLHERAEQIAALVTPGCPVHILTDLDRRGEKMYVTIKPLLQQAGIRLSTKLRAILLIHGISHVEGLYNFLKREAAINSATA